MMYGITCADALNKNKLPVSQVLRTKIEAHVQRRVYAEELHAGVRFIMSEIDFMVSDIVMSQIE